MTDQNDKLERLRKFRELFHGRYTDKESAVILEKFQGSLQDAVAFVMQSPPEDVRQTIVDEDQEWIQVKRKVRAVKANRPDILAKARAGLIDTTSRQFACGPCDNMWWRRCPDRKQVSKCNKCRVRYDPIPRDKEWGWAEFHCAHCGHEFGGFCQMGTQSPCFRCGKLILPTRIKPPSEQDRPEKRSRNHHSCSGRGCCGGQGGTGAPCVHPSTRLAHSLGRVIYASCVHDSTGSTVDTFLTQSDLQRPFEELFRPTLLIIPELPNESGGTT